MTRPTSREIPVLTTGRLVLRPPVFADFAAYERLMASPRAVYMNGPLDTKGAWAYFTHDVALWHLMGHGGLMIELKRSGTCVGQVGINHGPLFPEKELGWFLYDGYEGHGYATEAAARLRDWAFAEHGLTSLVSYIDPDNAASIAVARRLGATRDDAAPRDHPAVLVFRHTPPG
ncbi:MAG: GNAT family N-acetyltransferase [Alphaproteobacteria bacterium]|nr:GNAT family N-acetyltransferase [Alphaproteobacteria bacterium]